MAQRTPARYASCCLSDVGFLGSGFNVSGFGVLGIKGLRVQGFGHKYIYIYIYISLYIYIYARFRGLGFCSKVFCDLGVPEYEALWSLRQKGLSLVARRSSITSPEPRRIGVRSPIGPTHKLLGWDIPTFIAL